jgi:hypothetical protein
MSGIRFYSGGNFSYELGGFDTLSCFGGVVFAAAGSAGSQTDFRIGYGSPFWVALKEHPGTTTGTVKNIYFSGNTLNWDGGGDSCRIAYGVHEPNMAGRAVSGGGNFQIRYGAGKYYDRSIAAMCLVAHAGFNAPSGQITVDIPNGVLGQPTIVAWRCSAGYMALLYTGDLGSATRYVLNVETATFIEWYSLDRIPFALSSAVGGMRAWDEFGNLSFDSGYRFAQIGTLNNLYGGTDWDFGVKALPRLPGVQKVAVIFQDPGYRVYGNNPLNSQTVGIHTDDNAGAFLKPITFQVVGTAPGAPTVDNRMNAFFTTIDVTGL